MFAYCQSNPVNFQDSAGTRMVPANPLRGGPVGASSASGLNDNYSPGPSGSLTRKTTKKVKDLVNNINNYMKNEDEQVVLDAKFLAFYKGVPVLRTGGNRSGSFGIIALTKGTNGIDNPEDMLRHEYGHVLQMRELGVVDYALCIFLPSWQEWGTNTDYYSREYEITADILGGVQSRTHAKNDIFDGLAYMYYSDHFGIFAWPLIK